MDMDQKTDQKIIQEQPIGVFDSGVGGISVLSEMVRLLPHEDYLFFGDSANAPYGTRSADEICSLTLGHVKNLYDRGIKAIVIACNTATSAAIGELRRIYTDIPVIGIEPALKPAVQTGPHPRVLVLATPGTVRGRKWKRLEEHYEQFATVVSIPCPELVEYVEQGITEGPEIEAFLEQRLRPYMQEQVDAVVLGCTHYPFVRGEIRRLVGEGIPILDGSEGTARELRRRLMQQNLLSDRSRPGEVTFTMSRPGMEDLCRLLLEKRLRES